MPGPAPRRIGVLDTAGPDPVRVALWDLFKRRLGELGRAEHRDVDLELRWARGRAQTLAAAAAELVRLKVDVLVTAGTPAAAAATAATTDIPVVMATGTALDAAFAPGAPPRAANVTGMTDLPPGLSATRLDLLRQAIPGAAAFGILADRGNPSSPPAVRESLAAAGPLGIAVRDHWIAGAADFDNALAAMRGDGIAGFTVAPGALFFAARAELAACAVAHGLAAMTVRREYAEAGALVAYGASIAENYRRAADYVDKILRGARPAELAIDAPTAFELVVNLKTARALGLELPQGLLARAQTIGG